jgi:plastocyanin
MRRLALVVGIGALAVGVVAGPASAGSKTVKANNFDFKPQSVHIGKGDKVVWKNVQGRHTVTIKGTSYDKVISGNDKVDKKFKHQGTFKYICRFHKAQGMKGKVVVG